MIKIVSVLMVLRKYFLKIIWLKTVSKQARARGEIGAREGSSRGGEEAHSQPDVRFWKKQILNNCTKKQSFPSNWYENHNSFFFESVENYFLFRHRLGLAEAQNKEAEELDYYRNELKQKILFKNRSKN